MRMPPRFASVALACALAACSGGGSADGTPSTPGTPTSPSTPARTVVALTPSSSTLTPYQSAQVTFPSSAGAAGATLAGTLGTTAVTLSLVDSVTGAFLAPSMAAGTYTLTVDFGTSSRGTASLAVSAAPVIADAKASVNTAVAAVTHSADSLVAALKQANAGTATADVASLEATSAQLKSLVASMSSSEQQQFAAFLAANPWVVQPAVSVSAAAASVDPFAGTRRAANDGVTDALEGWMSSFFASQLSAIKVVKGCVLAGAAALFLGPAGQAAAAAACILAGAVYVYRVSGLLDQLGGLLVAPFELQLQSGGAMRVAALQAPSDPAPAAPGGVVAFAQEAAVPYAPSRNITVDPGTPYVISVTAKVRSLNAGDRNLIPYVFQGLDDLNGSISSLLRYVSNWVRPNLSLPSTSRNGVITLPSSVLNVQTPGCNAWAAGPTTMNIQCDIVSTSDQVINGTIQYSNNYGSATVALPITVRKTWATVGTPVVTRLSAPPWAVQGDGTYLRSCYFDMTIPVQGNTPVTFTRWDGVWKAGWPNDHTEGGNTDFTLDPRKYDGVKWWNNQLVSGVLPSYGNLTFSVNYTVAYRIAATGQTGTVQTVAYCP